MYIHYDIKCLFSLSAHIMDREDILIINARKIPKQKPIENPLNIGAFKLHTILQKFIKEYLDENLIPDYIPYFEKALSESILSWHNRNPI